MKRGWHVVEIPVNEIVADNAHGRSLYEPDDRPAEDIVKAVRSWRNDYLIPKYGDTDWKCPFVKRIMDALEAVKDARS